MLLVNILTLRAGRSGDQIPVDARYFAPLQTGPGAHPATGTLCTGSLSQGYSHRGVALTTHHRLAPS